MQQFIDKLISRLEGESYLTTNDDGETDKFSVQVVEWKDIKEIVNQLAEEYKGGWIPCSEQKPKDGQKVITCDDRGNLHVFRFEVSLNCFLDDCCRCIRENHPQFYVPIAWMPLPEPYQKEGE